MVELGQGRSWQTAPRVVRTARVLNNVAVVLNGLGVVVGLGVSAATYNHYPWQVLALSVTLFFCAMIALLLWLNSALRKGQEAGWFLQILLSGIGFCYFPVGTAIYGYILYQWFQPETKAWFGV